MPFLCGSCVVSVERVGDLARRIDARGRGTFNCRICTITIDHSVQVDNLQLSVAVLTLHVAQLRLQVTALRDQVSSLTWATAD